MLASLLFVFRYMGPDGSSGFQKKGNGFTCEMLTSWKVSLHDNKYFDLDAVTL